MRSALVVVLFAVSALAQDQSAVAAACGPKDVHFDVKLDNSQHTLAQPEPGKARVYFIQDVGAVRCLGGCLTTRIGLDGAWVGVNQHNSYFSVTVEPGEHHVCASPPSRLSPATSSQYAGALLALAHFNAEAGKVYYFRTRTFGDQFQKLFDIDALDSDQAAYLVAYYPLGVSRPKP